MSHHVGGSADSAAVLAEASLLWTPLRHVLCTPGPGSRIDAMLANLIAKHSLCDGRPGGSNWHTFECASSCCVPTGGITIARLKKIDLNFRGRGPEAEELLVNSVVAHILKKHHDEWTKARQQRDVQRLWTLWCEGGKAYLCERSQQVLGNRKKA